MDLKIKEVAELLNVSETTIRRWLSDGKIPAYRLNHQYRFSRIEIEDWVMKHKLGNQEEHASLKQPQNPEDTESVAHKSGMQQFSLYRALHKGGVYHQIPGHSKEEVIRSAMKKMAKAVDLDAEVQTDLLLDRENLMPTALNNGVGVPHTRDTLHPHHDVVAVVFPEKDIAYGALDGKPVHTLFFLFASEDKRHLHLLAKIAHLSSNPEAIRFFQTKPTKEALLEFIKNWEGS